MDCVVVCWRLHTHQTSNSNPFYFKWSQHKEINVNQQVTNIISCIHINLISRVYKSSQMVIRVFYFQVCVLNFMGNFPYLMLIVLKLGHFIGHLINILSPSLFGNFSRFMGFFFCFKILWKNTLVTSDFKFKLVALKVLWNFPPYL